MTPFGESTGAAKAKSSPETNPGVSGGGIIDLLLDIFSFFTPYLMDLMLNIKIDFLALLVNLTDFPVTMAARRPVLKIGRSGRRGCRHENRTVSSAQPRDG